MRFRLRKTFRLGPFFQRVTERGLTSRGIKLGPWTWNFTHGQHTVDTPGPGSFQSRRRRRRAR